MTQQEALMFLELPVTATAAELKTRLAEKLAHYELQSEKAPSDFLRRLNLRNLDKVKTILKESPRWPAFIPPPENPEPVEEPEESPDDTPQTVYIVSSMKEPVVKKPAKEPAKKKRPAGEPLGWLITHTEHKPVKIYPLQLGTNFLGRKQQPAMTPFIVVEGDDFISRVQCILYAEEKESITCYISDPSDFNKGKTSKNGTYINGHHSPVTTKIKLADGDTIQAGITKMVVRFNTASVDKIVKEVAGTGYIPTVMVEGA